MRLPGPVEAPLTSMATTMSALPGQQIEGQRVDQPAVHQQLIARAHHRREDRRQRHAGRNRAAQRAAVDHHLLLGIEVGRHDLERDLQLREVARDLRGQHHVEQRLGRQQGGMHRQDVEDLEDRLGARRDQQAGEAEALAGQDLFGMRANELGRQPGRVGGTEDRPDRGAGDDVGLEAQLIEHLQHQNVRQPARAAPTQRQRDRGPHGWQRRLADLDGLAGHGARQGRTFLPLEGGGWNATSLARHDHPLVDTHGELSSMAFLVGVSLSACAARHPHPMRPAT